MTKWYDYHKFQRETPEAAEANANDKSLILGIESSFDDTCAAVVEGTGRVLAN